MKLAARVTTPFEAPRRVGLCSVSVVREDSGDERSALIASGLEFGDVLIDEAATRSLSEFEVTLFAPLAVGEGSRIRVRRWHSYEGATSTLRDVWFEARLAEDRSILVQKSSPAPLASLRALSRARWMLDSTSDAPSVD